VNQNCAHLLQTVERKEAASGSLAIALRSDTEQSVYELALTYRIALRHPSDLPHPDRMHCLVTIDRYPWRFRRSESEPRCYLLLDEAMVLHNEVVQIRRCWATAAPVDSLECFNSLIARVYARCSSTLITLGRIPLVADNASREQSHRGQIP
jgi:hypothetical protein